MHARTLFAEDAGGADGDGEGEGLFGCLPREKEVRRGYTCPYVCRCMCKCVSMVCAVLRQTCACVFQKRAYKPTTLSASNASNHRTVDPLPVLVLERDHPHGAARRPGLELHVVIVRALLRVGVVGCWLAIDWLSLEDGFP